ncbi:MGMT family protein [Mucilaginibacter terrae]|uniref:Methylated-DNA-protein-cysteine methyltransferase-like protein n=1 Tax=Mucilaginibacter terrae TaxID=1955052 RepID=A0ABU3GVV5_9SPHI|nr:MGMT family protein [Mucilaginibacter terrae]MDT3403905.1 methylated-DNA-protein-cysteine methyltransferase-like protein [Mucilaginibacter terrae]
MAADPNFNNHVFEVARQVPAGRVTSYGAIAKFLGVPNWSRKVGHAMGMLNGVEPPVPFQRIVNSQGRLTGGTEGIEHRIELLAKEGVTVIGDKVQNFKTVYWDPSIELDY